MKKLFLTLFLAVLLVGTVNAVTWDNTGYYKLDGTSGTVSDSTTNNPGTANGGVTRGVTGKLNNAFDFDGNDDTITGITDVKGYTEGTVSFWFNPDSVTGIQTFYSTHSGGHDNRLALNGNKIDSSHQSEWYLTSSTTLSTGTWYFYTFTWNSTGEYLYLNGNLENQSSYGGGWELTGGAPVIGERSGIYDNEFDGTIDEFGVWDRALSHQEVSQLYNSGQGLEYFGVAGIDMLNIIYETQTNVNYTYTITNYSYTSVSGSMYYNGSEVSSSILQSNPSNVSLISYRDIPLTTSAEAVEVYFNVTVTNSTGTFNIISDSQNQTINTIHFSICNETYPTKFLNISFKDESDLSEINASIPTSTFIYYLGDGTINKSYTYINNSLNNNYSFCASPSSETFYTDIYLQYKQGTDYPQRIYEPSLLSLTNEITNATLYLLSSIDGIYVTFQIVNNADQVIEGVDVTASRTIDGSTVIVGTGTTGAAGSVTFWLNPDFSHSLTFEADGYDTFTTSLVPTQTSYTITLGGQTSTEPDYTRGINYSVQPAKDYLENGTLYNFNFTVNTNDWLIDGFGFSLTYENGTLISEQTSSANGGTVSYNFNTGNESLIYMNYFYTINGTNQTGTRYWIIEDVGNRYSLNNFFNRVSTYFDANMLGIGGEDGTDNFGKAFISVIILILVSGGLTYRYGINNEAAIMGIIFGIVLFLDVGIGFIPNPIMATNAGVSHLVTIVAGLILVALLIKEEIAR